MSALIVFVPVGFLACSALAAFLMARARRTSGQVLEARLSEQPFAHELPYWAFIDDGGLGIAVHVDLTHSALFKVSGLDVDCASADALRLLHLGLHGVLENLPTGTILQFLHFTDGQVSEAVESYRQATSRATGIGDALVEGKIADVSGNPTLRRSCLYLSVVMPRKGAKAPVAGFSFVRKFPRFTGEEHAEAVRRLRTLTAQVSRGLSAIGVSAEPVKARDLRALLYQLLNPARAEVVADPFPSANRRIAARAVPWSSSQSAREQLLYTGIEEKRDRLVLDRKVVRVLTLKSLPSFTETALLETLLVALPFHARVHVAIELSDSAKSLDDLKRKRDQAHLLATLREKRNQEAEAQEDDAQELIEKNLRSSIRMVEVALSVVLTVDAHAENPDAVLEKQTAEVVRVLSSLYSAQVMVDELGQLDEFLATLPGNARRGRRFHKCTSENAAHLFPVWQPYGGTASPLLLVQNGRANLVGLDPFDSSLDNPNAFMAGASGAGKSSTTNYLLIHLLAAGARALVIDVGGSYRRVIDLFGGDYFAVGLEDASLNLFFSPADCALPDGKIEDRRLAFMMAVVERMVCDRSRPELKQVERAVLASAIQKTYARARSTPILSDLVQTLREANFGDPEDAELARSLARSLRVWTEGPAARLLNRPSTIELTTQCAAFDLKGLEAHGELQSVVLLVLSGMIWNLVMRDQTERKVVVFDEVWRLLESPASAQLIAELYRTSRKYRCSILTISQSVEDFTTSSIAPALINNSASVYLLKHRRGHDLVAQQFQLNERELEIFSGLEMRRGEYTEALVLYGPHHFLARIVLTPLEYWIATTHPQDLALENAFTARNPRWSRLEILSELARRYPGGATGPARSHDRAPARPQAEPHHEGEPA